MGAAWLCITGVNARHAATMISTISGISQRRERLNIGLPSFFLTRATARVPLMIGLRGRPRGVPLMVGLRGRRKRPHPSSTSTPAPTMTASVDGLCRRARCGDCRIAGRMQVESRWSARQNVLSNTVRQLACAIAGRFPVHFCERDVSILPVPGKDSIRTFGIFQVCVLYQPKGTK